MKTYLYFILNIYVFFLISFKASAQENTEQETGKDDKKAMHQLTLVISHSIIAPGENSERITVPSWAVDYDYWISSHWAIGLHNDIILESYEVINSGSEEGSTIERTNPISSVAAVVFKPKKHSLFILGMGAEFAKEENLALTRIGYEYGWEIGKNWDLGAGIVYDIKWHTYDTWIIGLGVSRFFGGKEE
jgi:hypothetical protein